ncbi:MAG: cyclic nucleotide-binding domain-containing protein [Magnetococcales bacterium]|nr:cyclic nucleotide-binding domain-containing protein [Magnetococcales bacterium]NGZ05523.1 cyclic nucleotide-binding domain-containing protein [Magnetococcales bacterium]
MSNCQLILEALAFPQPFSEQESALLCAGQGVQRMEAGDVLIREGARDRDMWLVVQGGCHVVKRMQPNLPLGTLGPGSFCGEIAWFTGHARTASVVAFEPGLALRLSFDDIDNYPAGLMLKIYHNVLADVINRKEVLHDTLFRLASLERERYGGGVTGSPVGFLRGFSMFEGLTPEEAGVLRALPPGVEFIRPGGYLFREGERYDTMFLLLKGSVKVTVLRDPALALVNLGAERLLGLDSLFRDGVHGANHVAVETCEGIRIGLAEFLALDPVFRLKLYWRMALTLINRLAPINVARIKLEHMEGKMWFGG